MNWSLLNYFPSTKILSHRYGYGEIRILLNVPLKDVSMEMVKVEEFRLWMSQSCFSLRFLSQNSLWKLFTIRGYKRYLYWCVFGMWKVSFSQTKWSGDLTLRLDLATWLSREFKSRANSLVRLEVLSCSAPAGVTLQLLCMFHTCVSFGDLLAASQSRGLVESTLLSFFFTLSHTLPLHDSHLNTGFLNAEL